MANGPALGAHSPRSDSLVLVVKESRSTIWNLLVVPVYRSFLSFCGHLERDSVVEADVFQETSTSERSALLGRELADVVSDGTAWRCLGLCGLLWQQVAGDSA